LNPVLSQNNFFTKDFDNEKTDDILEKLKNQTATASDLKQYMGEDEEGGESTKSPEDVRAT
jgi:hypothetical protein